MTRAGPAGRQGTTNVIASGKTGSWTELELELGWQGKRQPGANFWFLMNLSFNILEMF